MPTQSTERTSTTEETRAAVTGLIDAFTRGDGERIVEYFDDDVDWLFVAPASIFPFAGTRHGKTDVLKGLAALYEGYRVADYHVTTMIVEGDRASTLSEGHLVQRASGRIIRVRTANFYRFRAGKVIEYRGYTDSLDIAEQVLGRELDF
ncbi:MAG: nuclear transport factor 2 family protein [Pseudolabrys sp.]